VGDDVGGKAELMAGPVEIIAELTNERGFTCWTSQEPTVCWQRVEEAEEAQALDEFTDEGIDGDHAFGFEFAQRDMDGPPGRSDRTEALLG
jgi:hypothetical protein